MRPILCTVLIGVLAVGAVAREKPVGEGEQDGVWGRLTAEQAAEAVEQLKEFAREAQEKIGHRGLQSFETDYFLFVTDLEPREARLWNGVLDRMHNDLLNMFALPRGTNVWHGKALVFVFRSKQDFARYEAEVEKNPMDLSHVGGLCHQHGPVVRISFYRQGDDARFAHVLVHEASHGFIHRYRSEHRLPSWVNEGLAEWIAYRIPRPRRPDSREIDALKTRLRELGHTEGLFDKSSIDLGWHYELAYTLTDFMISQNRRGYVAFINAMKTGKPWRSALEEDYGAPLERLVTAYGAAMGVGPLRP